MKASHVHDLLAWHLAEKTTIKSSSFVKRTCMSAQVADTWYHASSWAIHREDVVLGDGSIFFRAQWHNTEQDVYARFTVHKGHHASSVATCTLPTLWRRISALKEQLRRHDVHVPGWAPTVSDPTHREAGTNHKSGHATGGMNRLQTRLDAFFP